MWYKNKSEEILPLRFIPPRGPLPARRTPPGGPAGFRQAICEVFWRRAASPGHGGAVVREPGVEICRRERLDSARRLGGRLLSHSPTPLLLFGACPLTLNKLCSSLPAVGSVRPSQSPGGLWSGGRRARTSFPAACPQNPVLGLVCVSAGAALTERPRPGGFNSGTSSFRTWFRGLEAHDQGVSGLDFPRPLSLARRWPSSPCVPHTVFSVSRFPLLEGHQSYWTRSPLETSH